MNLLTWENIEQVYNEYYTWYSNEKGEEKGLKLFTKPNIEKKFVSQTTFAFLTLWLNIGEVLSKETLTNEYRSLIGNHYNGDFQAGRHIGNGTGYNVKNYHHSLNGYCLVDKTYTIKEKRDSELLTESVWLSIKQEYNYKCACCGCSEGDEMTRANGTCKLEKGHMDPDLPLTSDNTIPQCPYCNGSSKDKRKFNNKGDTIAIKEKNTGNWIYC
jgi:hypothetical protein